MIASLSDLKAQLLITSVDDDSVLTQLVGAADAFIAQYTGRDFAGGAFTERHAAGGSRIFLRNFPVTAITSLRVDADRIFGSETELDSSLYVLVADRGVVESREGPFLTPRSGQGSRDWPASVQVSYTTEAEAIPPAVTAAFNQLVSHWYRLVKTGADTGFRDVIELTDGTSTKGYPWNVTSGLKVPGGVVQLLDAYRVPAI